MLRTIIFMRFLSMRYSRDLRYVICDICGFKYHIKDATKVTDQYSRHNGLIVCKKDLDTVNPQARPFTFSETILASPETVRPRVAESYVTNENDDRVPGKPTNGLARANPYTDTIDLFWDAPTDNGSSGITGYRVQYAAPQGGSYIDLIVDTNTSSAYYNDTTLDLVTEYSFRIAAINTFGTGAYSDEFFWPFDRMIWRDLNYLVVSQDGTILTTSDSTPIRVNHTEVGLI